MTLVVVERDGHRTPCNAEFMHSVSLRMRELIQPLPRSLLGMDVDVLTVLFFHALMAEVYNPSEEH